MSKKQQQLVSLAELALEGVKVTICRPAKAKGVRKQLMRGKGVGAFITGGNRPIGYTQSAY